MIREKLERSKLAWLGLALAMTFFGCDDEGGPAADTGTDAVTEPDVVEDMVPDMVPDTEDAVEEEVVENPRVTACREAITTLETAVADELTDWPITDAPEMVPPETGSQNLEADYAGHYRDDVTARQPTDVGQAYTGGHPGCLPQESYGPNVEFLITDNEATVPDGAQADVSGYPCAAKEYAQDSEDTSLPIVILVHGNSSGVTSFEEYFNSTLAGTELSNYQGFTFTADTTVRPMLATRLLEEGYRVIAFDARTDLVAYLGDFSAEATGNPYHNIDHGWAVPMLMSLVKAVMTDNPDRMVAIVAHSLGATVTRDALRRLYLEWRNGDEGAINPYAHLTDVILASGANHGVASGQLLCDSFLHNMRGTVGCEMGDRAAFVPTYFSERLNGPDDLFSAPCADGSYAFGERDQCEGNVVEWTTITMEDLPGGELQDEFVSEASSELALEPCVENVLIGLESYDSSGYFFTGAPGFIANHFGSIRSNEGMQDILDRLSD